MISAIVLAAGSSSRLGRPKQLLRLGDRTVIEHVVDRVLASSVDRVIIVLGHEADKIRAVLGDRDIDVVVNESYREGQGTSLVTGMRHVMDDETCEAVVLVLADQPSGSSAVIDRVVGAWRKCNAPIATATYGSQRSHPVIFARDVFPELLAITGDQGARSVIRRYGDRVEEVDSNESDLPADIDTEEAYREMVARWPDYEAKAP